MISYKEFIELTEQQQNELEEALAVQRLYVTRISAVAAFVITITIVVVVIATSQEQRRPFQYIGDRNAAGVVIYEPEAAQLCPGETLRYFISVETTEIAIDVIVKYKFLYADGRNIGQARYEERVLDRSFVFTNQLREEVVPSLPPGFYRLVGGATTTASSSDMYAVPFEIRADCNQFLRK